MFFPTFFLVSKAKNKKTMSFLGVFPTFVGIPFGFCCFGFMCEESKS